MSAIHTGYQSHIISSFNNSSQENLNRIKLPVYKYLDIDSTYRNRIDYPDPNSFVVRNANSLNMSPYNLVAFNLPVYSFPFSELYSTGVFSPLTFFNGGVNNLILSNLETTTIPNFYAGYILESIAPTTTTPTTTQYSTVQYRTIASYDSPNQTVTLTEDFANEIPPTTVAVVVGSNYIIRKNKPIFIGNISTVTSTTEYILTKPLGAGYGFVPVDNNSIYYLRVRKSATSLNDNVIVPITLKTTVVNNVSTVVPNTIILSSPLSLTVNDSVEIVGPGQNIITSLRYASGGSQSIQGGDYELELLWLSVPNQVLDVGYGGTLDRYPYIYCSLYTGITNTTQQVLYSNNPHTSKVIFKVPVNEYFGDTSFITLKDSKAKQTIYFDPSQDLFFELTLPDGTVISFNEFDNPPPYPPNPFLQINILVSMKKI